MESGKLNSGSIFRVPPLSAWNNAMEAGALVASGKLDPRGNRTQPEDDNGIVHVRNNTGTSLDRGDAICLGDLVLSDIDHERPWFEGSLPSSSELPYGVLLDPIPSGADSWGRVRIQGICYAKIDKIYDSHPYAHIKNGDNQLQTDWHGQAEIIAKKEYPASSGQWWAAVRLGNYRSVILDAVVTTSSIAFGATGTADVWRAGSVTSPAQNLPLTFRHVGAGRTLAVGTKVKAYYDNADHKLVVLSADCP